MKKFLSAAEQAAESEDLMEIFQLAQSILCRPSWSVWAVPCVSGAASTCWRVMDRITPAAMLIYGKEATTQIENSVPYYSVSKWSSNTKMLLLHFHAP